MDYFDNTNNEGHIKIKITNDGKENKKMIVNSGDSFCQGIITQYFLTENDNVIDERIGGIGSTSNKNN